MTWVVTSQVGNGSLVSVIGMHDLEGGRWLFQVAPGLLLAEPDITKTGQGSTTKYNYIVNQAGVRRSFPHDTDFGGLSDAIYVGLLYRPWGLGFNYIIPLTLDAPLGNTDKPLKFSNYSITLTRKWGGT